MKEYHRKLIRDKIPEIITSTGGQFETRILGEKEFKRELKKKLIEESKELNESPEDEILNELTDILELVKSIGQNYNISFKVIQQSQVKKHKERGGFKKKLYLVWSTKKTGI
jgi:predicted house-cleaning noncanonical NTP pyrophosphatase (MazG superfamily)